MYCCLIFFTYLLIISSESKLDTGVCRRNDSTGFENFCCDDYEPKIDDKSKCQECLPGFTSVKGRPCYQCKGTSFGKKCSSECNCSKSEICDNVRGCVLPKQTTERGENSMTFVGIYHSTCSTATGYRNTDWNKGGISHMEPLIYIAVIGWFAVFIVLCVICRKRVIKLLPYFHNGQRVSMSRDETLPSISEPNFQIRHSLNDIDKQNMLDNVGYRCDRNACNVSLSHA